MATESPAPYRLTLLGPWDLRGPTGKKVRSVLAQPKRLCLLAYLALAGEPVSRATLVSLFWPERDEDRARNALSQSLHYLRRSLGPGVVESVEGDRVRVAPESIWFDARALLNGGGASEEATGGSTANGDREAASGGARRTVAAGEGSPEARRRMSELARPVRAGRDFFQGWNADGSQPLQDWLDEVRRRVRERAEEVREAGAGQVGGARDGNRGEGAADGDEEAADGAEQVAAGGGEATAEPGSLSGPGGAATPGRAAVRRAAWVWGGVALGILLTLGVLRLGPDPPVTGAGPGADLPEVAVLFPRVTIVGEAPAFSAEALAQAVHDELVVRLGSVQGVRPVRIAVESEVFQLVRSLDAQGSREVPEWILSIRIRSGGDRARVVALLLRGPDYTDTEIANAGDYVVPAGAEALVELPRRIATEMTVGMGEVVGGGS